VLSSRKVLVVEDHRGPIFKSSSLSLKPLTTTLPPAGSAGWSPAVAHRPSAESQNLRAYCSAFLLSVPRHGLLFGSGISSRPDLCTFLLLRREMFGRQWSIIRGRAEVDDKRKRRRPGRSMTGRLQSVDHVGRHMSVTKYTATRARRPQLVHCMLLAWVHEASPTAKQRCNKDQVVSTKCKTRFLNSLPPVEDVAGTTGCQIV